MIIFRMIGFTNRLRCSNPDVVYYRALEDLGKVGRVTRAKHESPVAIKFEIEFDAYRIGQLKAVLNENFYDYGFIKAVA